MEDRELVCLILEDHLPNLYIDGVEYLRQLPEESREKNVAFTASGPDNNTQQPVLIDSSDSLSKTNGTNKEFHLNTNEVHVCSSLMLSPKTPLPVYVTNKPSDQNQI